MYADLLYSRRPSNPLIEVSLAEVQMLDDGGGEATIPLPALRSDLWLGSIIDSACLLFLFRICCDRLGVGWVINSS